MVEFMKERLGEEFEGHISGLTEWGVYVELDETHIEGMAFLRDVEGDYFDFDEQRYEVVGRMTGRRMTLGDPVRIRVKRADLQKRQLDFELLLDGVARSGRAAKSGKSSKSDYPKGAGSGRAGSRKSGGSSRGKSAKGAKVSSEPRGNKRAKVSRASRKR